jgi:hypothetical protein
MSSVYSFSEITKEEADMARTCVARLKRSGLAIVIFILLGLGQMPAEPWKATAVYVLPGIRLSDFLQETLHLTVEDHNIKLGGVGSDLWHSKENDGPGVYWMITDRGPNDEDPRTFPVPEFTPFILKVRTANGAIEILEAIPIRGTGAVLNGVTGLANLTNTTAPPALNEPIFDCAGTLALTPNSHGLDTEGIIRTSDGFFWVVEEYSPSILKIAPDGKVVKRFMPRNLLQYLPPITGYATSEALPEIYGQRRRLNRGFEGIALSPDEQTIYVGLQSPFLTPTGNTGRDSRNTRILAFNTVTEQVVAEYVYRFQPFAEFNVANQPDPPFDPNRARDMKISALAMLDQHRMLVLERTDFIAKIYRVDLRTATNILGQSTWDDSSASTSASLEAVTDLQAAGITPLAKEIVLALDSTLPVNGVAIPQKLEGMTVLDGKTVAVANDNDFGVGSFTVDDSSCLLNDSGSGNKIIVLRLDQPLKK